MEAVANDDLIAAAEAVLNPHSVAGIAPRSRGRHLGYVGCALLTPAGNHYCGVSIDTGSGTGFCAEAAAIAAMVTAREHQIAKIVAVCRGDDGHLRVLPPCGRCREFMRQIDPANLGAEVVLGRTEAVRLRELLPLSEWPGPLG